MANVFNLLIARMRQHGVLGVVRRLPTTIRWTIQRLLDRMSGVETFEQVLVEDLDIADDLKAHCLKYETTSRRSIRHVINALHACLYEDFVLIDIGSGKGRVLLTASEFPFKRIIGVEISQTLCRIARQNIASLARTNPSYPPIDIVCHDAQTYTLPDENCIVYLFNPMDREMMTGIRNNIEKWMETTDRRLYLIYLNPVQGDLFENSPNFIKLSEQRLLRDLSTPYNHGYAIYKGVSVSRIRESVGATETVRLGAEQSHVLVAS